MMFRKSALVFCVVVVACVPHRDLPADQIEKLTKLTDVMDVQATVADPQFKKIGQDAYSDADWQAFTDLASRLQATSTKAHQFSKGPEFDKFADDLHTKAQHLGEVAASKDMHATSDALGAIKAVCKDCHSKFK